MWLVRCHYQGGCSQLGRQNLRFRSGSHPLGGETAELVLLPMLVLLQLSHHPQAGSRGFVWEHPQTSSAVIGICASRPAAQCDVNLI